MAHAHYMQVNARKHQTLASGFGIAEPPFKSKKVYVLYLGLSSCSTCVFVHVIYIYPPAYSGNVYAITLYVQKFILLNISLIRYIVLCKCHRRLGSRCELNDKLHIDSVMLFHTADN